MYAAAMMNLTGATNAPHDPSSSGTRDICLPNQNDEPIGFGFSLDLGGSLSKVVFISKEEGEGYRLRFHKFFTHSIESLIEFIAPMVEQGLSRGLPPLIKATGGGAIKFASLFEEKLKVKLHAEDEMLCLIRGLNFLLRGVMGEVFTCESQPVSSNESYQAVHESGAQMALQPFNVDADEMFPYMLVNIGSGVSIIKVSSETVYERVSGTSLGGGTLMGLVNMITNVGDFDEMLSLASRGDNRNVDMLVGDIYGADYPAIGLKAGTIASSLGKVWQHHADDPPFQRRKEDVCKSALLMVSNNIAQIGYLNARYHNISRIYFGGSFIRGYVDTMKTISYGVDFWSKGEMKALFLRHDGYIGCLGAFLGSEERLRKRKASLAENIALADPVDVQHSAAEHSHKSAKVDSVHA